MSLMLSLSKEDMTGVLTSMSSKIPEPLTSQFPEKLSKQGAMKRQSERKRKVQELYPEGWSITF